MQYGKGSSYKQPESWSYFYYTDEGLSFQQKKKVSLEEIMMGDFNMAYIPESEKLISAPSPEHVLALFVLLRALFDIKRGPADEARDARRWFSGCDASDEPFSFRYCCEALSDKPEELTEYCLEFVTGSKPWPFLRFGGRRDASLASKLC